MDSSIGVLNGVNRICEESHVDPEKISRVMHGTTVATNAVLTERGAVVGLVTTKGYKHTLQVARSFCPGGLGGWVSFVKKPLLAKLELTIEADERMDANGIIIRELDEEALYADLTTLHAKGEVESLTICFINAYLNGENEQLEGQYSLVWWENLADAILSGRELTDGIAKRKLCIPLFFIVIKQIEQGREPPGGGSPSAERKKDI